MSWESILAGRSINQRRQSFQSSTPLGFPRRNSTSSTSTPNTVLHTTTISAPIRQSWRLDEASPLTAVHRFADQILFNLSGSQPPPPPTSAEPSSDTIRTIVPAWYVRLMDTVVRLTMTSVVIQAEDGQSGRNGSGGVVSFNDFLVMVMSDRVLIQFFEAKLDVG
jgi:hypothetical protein